jgi:Leucine-rich repeat (LRR) protein
LLSGNEIKTLEGLRPLFKLKKLIDLDLSENPVA